MKIVCKYELPCNLAVSPPLFRQPVKGFERKFTAISVFVARIVGMDSADAITCDQRSIQLNQEIVHDVAHLQLFAERRLRQRAFVLT